MWLGGVAGARVSGRDELKALRGQRAEWETFGYSGRRGEATTLMQQPMQHATAETNSARSIYHSQVRRLWDAYYHTSSDA